MFADRNAVYEEKFLYPHSILILGFYFFNFNEIYCGMVTWRTYLILFVICLALIDIEKFNQEGRLIYVARELLALYLVMKWHGIVVSMMVCGPEGRGSIPHLAKDHNDVIFFLGVFLIQFDI